MKRTCIGMVSATTVILLPPFIPINLPRLIDMELDLRRVNQSSFNRPFSIDIEQSDEEAPSAIW